ERLKAAVLKTADGKPSESSNLSSSATLSALGNKAAKIDVLPMQYSFKTEGWPSGLRQRS
ncbi:hypothetical protein WKH08_12175, partial [Pantoea agglomerans]|uniref:hypothetical protein n=1 Tax=Enterobacter agglomerans TaxID=549 RepID=UPI003C7AF77D